MEKALRPDHPDTAQSLNNLAQLYADQGAYAKAEPLHLRALAIREKALGPDHPDTAQSLNNLALIYAKQGAYAKAEPLHLRALAIMEKALGSNHPSTIEVRENLEQCRKALGNKVVFLRNSATSRPVSSHRYRIIIDCCPADYLNRFGLASRKEFLSVAPAWLVDRNNAALH